jgi:hypothetical protein
MNIKHKFNMPMKTNTPPNPETQARIHQLKLSAGLIGVRHHGHISNHFVPVSSIKLMSRLLDCDTDMVCDMGICVGGGKCPSTTTT